MLGSLEDRNLRGYRNYSLLAAQQAMASILVALWVVQLWHQNTPGLPQLSKVHGAESTTTKVVDKQLIDNYLCYRAPWSRQWIHCHCTYLSNFKSVLVPLHESTNEPGWRLIQWFWRVLCRTKWQWRTRSKWFREEQVTRSTTTYNSYNKSIYCTKYLLWYWYVIMIDMYVWILYIICYVLRLLIKHVRN